MHSVRAQFLVGGETTSRTESFVIKGEMVNISEKFRISNNTCLLIGALLIGIPKYLFISFSQL